MFVVDREELAWAAGFFDGEGYVGLMKTKQGRYRLARMVIHQIDTHALFRFRRAVGVGGIGGPYINRRTHHKSYYAYQAAGAEAQAVLAMLWRWLGPIKRADAVRVFAAYRQYRSELRSQRQRRLSL